MLPLTASDIQDLDQYELGREAFRRSVIELKSRRRLALGPLMSIVFENRDTVRFQIQEMLRVERIVQPERVAREIEMFNELGRGDQVLALLTEGEPGDSFPNAMLVRRREVIAADGSRQIVTEDKEFPDNSLIIGAPAKAVRTLTPEQVAQLTRGAASYVRNGKRYKAGLKKIG